MRISNELRTEIKQLVISGMSVKDVANLKQVSLNTVYIYARYNGVAKKTHKDYYSKYNAQRKEKKMDSFFNCIKDWIIKYKISDEEEMSLTDIYKSYEYHAIIRKEVDPISYILFYGYLRNIGYTVNIQKNKINMEKIL